jgi:MFS transporter, CP family, cyanate transporter
MVDRVLTAQRLAIVAVFLAGIGARTQLIIVGPVLPEMTTDLGISHAIGGLLITLPVLLMAAVAIPTTGLGHRFGSRRVMAVSLALLAAAGTARPIGNDMLWLLALTVPIGIGIGVIGVILPIFVKEHASEMPARATGLYVTAMLVGSSLGGTFAAPLAEWGGSWRVPLLVFGLAGVIPVLGWIALTKPDHVSVEDRPERSPLPWRNRVAWLLVAAFSLQALIFYGLVAWLAPVMVESGYSTIEAGTIVGVLLIAGIPGTLLVSWLGDRLPSRRVGLVTTSVASLVAVAGYTGLPGLAILWSIVGGLGLAAIFALVMTLPLDAARRPAEAGGYTGLMLGAGYLIASIAPSLLGAARDLTGNFTLTMLLLFATAGVMLAVSLVLSPSRLGPMAKRG